MSALTLAARGEVVFCLGGGEDHLELLEALGQDLSAGTATLDMGSLEAALNHPEEILGVAEDPELWLHSFPQLAEKGARLFIPIPFGKGVVVISPLDWQAALGRDGLARYLLGLCSERLGTLPMDSAGHEVSLQLSQSLERWRSGRLRWDLLGPMLMEKALTALATELTGAGGISLPEQDCSHRGRGGKVVRWATSFRGGEWQTLTFGRGASHDEHAAYFAVTELESLADQAMLLEVDSNYPVLVLLDRRPLLLADGSGPNRTRLPGEGHSGSLWFVVAGQPIRLNAQPGMSFRAGGEVSVRYRLNPSSPIKGTKSTGM
ncbi:MAG: hypothetical protein ACYTGH_07575 [Planctomycetota bacterium]